MLITRDTIQKAEQCLIDNGIEKDEAPTVLQALGYILLDAELYSNQTIIKTKIIEPLK